MMHFVGNLLLGLATGSLGAAAILGDTFILSGRTYYAVMCAFVCVGSLLRMTS